MYMYNNGICTTSYAVLTVGDCANCQQPEMTAGNRTCGDFESLTLSDTSTLLGKPMSSFVWQSCWVSIFNASLSSHPQQSMSGKAVAT